MERDRGVRTNRACSCERPRPSRRAPRRLPAFWTRCSPGGGRRCRDASRSRPRRAAEAASSRGALLPSDLGTSPSRNGRHSRVNALRRGRRRRWFSQCSPHALPAKPGGVFRLDPRVPARRLRSALPLSGMSPATSAEELDAVVLGCPVASPVFRPAVDRPVEVVMPEIPWGPRRKPAAARRSAIGRSSSRASPVEARTWMSRRRILGLPLGPLRDAAARPAGEENKPE
jgi:hypothetical protein